MSGSSGIASRVNHDCGMRKGTLHKMGLGWAQGHLEGIFKPKKVHDLVITRRNPEWKSAFLNKLKQQRFWENRTASKEPPRKVPFEFRYKFECDDSRCHNHQMMIEDWELDALYWKCVDEGNSPDEACRKVKQKFLEEICGPDRDTHFYVCTVLAHPKSWVAIGTFWPKIAQYQSDMLSLFN
jgi:hypothetical protein